MKRFTALCWCVHIYIASSTHRPVKVLLQQIQSCLYSHLLQLAVVQVSISWELAAYAQLTCECNWESCSWLWV